MHAELGEALRRRLEIVADRGWYERDSADHLMALRQATDRVQTLTASLPAGTDPALRHYLERQSYVKALDWLEQNSGIEA